MIRFWRNNPALCIYLGFFIVTLVGYAVFQWFDYVQSQQGHSEPVLLSEYLIATTTRALENIQSEFLQLLMDEVVESFVAFLGLSGLLALLQDTNRRLRRLEREITGSEMGGDNEP